MLDVLDLIDSFLTSDDYVVSRRKHAVFVHGREVPPLATTLTINASFAQPKNLGQDFALA